MISRTSLLGLIAGATMLMSGCVTKRDILEIVAHKDYNNYKIQTFSTHGFGMWYTWEVWSCEKKGAGFTCHEIDYDGSKKGFDNGGAKSAPAAEPAADAAPAEGAAPAAEEGAKK